MKQLRLRNTQRVRQLDLQLLRRATVALLDELLRLPRYELAVHFIPVRRMAAMNQQFLDHEGSTDVITFDYREGYGRDSENDGLSGEIFISVADAVAQSDIFKRPWDEELLRYIVHGVLHLQGFDDRAPSERKRMKAAENRLLKNLRRKIE
jgi:probable rRNA maturation factor